MSDCITHSVDTTGMESCSARCNSASGMVGSATTTFMLLSKTLFRLPKSKEKKKKQSEWRGQSKTSIIIFFISENTLYNICLKLNKNENCSTLLTITSRFHSHFGTCCVQEGLPKWTKLRVVGCCKEYSFPSEELQWASLRVFLQTDHLLTQFAWEFFTRWKHEWSPRNFFVLEKWKMNIN